MQPNRSMVRHGARPTMPMRIALALAVQDLCVVSALLFLVGSDSRDYYDFSPVQAWFHGTRQRAESLLEGHSILQPRLPTLSRWLRNPRTWKPPLRLMHRHRQERCYCRCHSNHLYWRRTLCPQGYPRHHCSGSRLRDSQLRHNAWTFPHAGTLRTTSVLRGSSTTQFRRPSGYAQSHTGRGLLRSHSCSSPTLQVARDWRGR
jgi:hypothetical protein